MKGPRLLSAGVAAALLALPAPGGAFECPTHIHKAETAIHALAQRLRAQRITARVAVNDTDLARARTLLTNARITLLAARRLHDNSRTPADHAQAIAKAYAATGFVLAADPHLPAR